MIKLEIAGFTLFEVYECELKENKEFQNFFKDMEKRNVLNLSIQGMRFSGGEQM